MGLHRCDHCRSEFLAPQPSGEWLTEIYAQYPSIRGGLHRPKQRFFTRLLEACGLDLDDRSVLELGGAEGDCAAAVRRRWPSARLTVVDPAPAVEQRARPGGEGEEEPRWERVSLETWLADAPPVAYDVVLAFDLIEHLRRPAEALSQVVERHLAPGGRLVASFPNVDGSWRRLLGHHWLHYKPEHLVYLSRRGVDVLASAAGLETQRLTPLVKHLPLEYLLGVGARSGPAVPRRLAEALSGLLPILPKRIRGAELPFALGEWLWLAQRRASDQSSARSPQAC